MDRASARDGDRLGKSIGIGPIGLAAFVGLALVGVAACSHVDELSSAEWRDGQPPAVAEALPADVQAVEAMNVDDKSQILAEGEDAEQRNAAIPVTTASVEMAGRFLLQPSAGEVYKTALQCLSQAVYYEAANEPMAGRRAVAQVVLNRVRHPAYPKSVCGVVYEGSARPTGCQFSFTCDGSLLRSPSSRQWREAQDVARKALAGHVEESVGMATNYHADYVLPKWAFKLAKIRIIGRHIFYRLPGWWGKRTVFSEPYSGIERIPSLDRNALSARLAERDNLDTGKAAVPGLTVPPAVTDRHAANDVGGRIDVNKEWRLSIPDPVAASARYRAATAGDTAASDSEASSSATPAFVAAPLAMADTPHQTPGVSRQ